LDERLDAGSLRQLPFYEFIAFLVVQFQGLGFVAQRVFGVALPVGLEHADVIERAQLVGHLAAVVVIFVHLQGLQAEHPVGGPAVANHALSAAGIVPDLGALAGFGGDGEAAVAAFSLH